MTMQRIRWVGVLVALGSVSTACESTLDPQPVRSAFTSVHAGWDFTCAIGDNDAAYCWGLQTQARLGVDRLTEPCDGQRCLEPVPVSGGLRVDAMGVGESHACGLSDQRMYCWGWNRFGQLGSDWVRTQGCGIDGTGDVLPCSTEPLAVALGEPVQTLAVGPTHACAVTDREKAYCWGWNREGQLGIGTWGGQSLIPVPVAESPVFVRLAAGQDHTCGLTADGVAYCWGAGSAGRLGHGSESASYTPVATVTAPPFAGIAAGGGHTCAITATAELYCWGAGYWGQLGLGPHSSTRPLPISVPGPVRQVTLGYGHTCAVTTASTLYCWGLNASGQLGIGTTADAHEPVAVELPERVASVSAGHDHTCAAVESGTIYCWGDNTHGQLGVGDRLARLLPTAIGS